MNRTTRKRGASIRRNALAVALAVGLGLSGGVAFAQSTQGSIRGSAPEAAGETVKVVSETGLTRTVTVGADGNYVLRNLPVGTYEVQLIEDGSVTSTRESVAIAVGSATEVNFGAQHLAAVEVSANALPPIDVTTTASSFTMTEAQLQRQPVARSAEAIAMLSPGVVQSSGYFGNALTVAGAGATENAYYVNGYNTTALYDYTGSSYQLPYGSIAQQETIVGGYGAKYGRADGGVINQVGKRGTNEWHFGGQVVWIPRALSADPRNKYYPNIELQPGEHFETDARPGDLYQYRNENKGWSTQMAAYVGGPIVEDRLFFFLSAETTKDKNKYVYSVNTNQVDFYKKHGTKYYAKIDWNINENNVLEFTELKQNTKSNYGSAYVYDNDAGMAVGQPSPLTYDEYNHETRIFHYTGYLTDKATLSVLYGFTEVSNPSVTPNASPLPRISGAGAQNPALNGGSPITNAQNTTYVSDLDRSTRSKSLRLDFSYRLGDHLLMAGIDNLKYTGKDQGQKVSGPGYLWIYGKQDPATDPINPGLDVGAPGGEGYFVTKYIFETLTNMSAVQKAWYIQDQWQVTPNLLVTLGLRNDHFKNLNADGVAFVDEENQWEPRVGFSWDVFGDSSLKVYSHLGRYYLAIPMATGERAAGNSLYTREYFTYTGINPETGEPTGLSCVPTIGGAPGVDCPGPTSANGEFGQAVDPNTVTSTNLKPQYQDEFILGFDKTLGTSFVYGAKFTYRTVGTIIDDVCVVEPIHDNLVEMGYNPDDWAFASPFCHIFNPNRTNIFKVESKANPGEYIEVPVTQEDFGFPDAQRDYYALDLYFEHPFDGTWTGRIDYTFARSWGNAEGQVRSDIGQTDVSATEDWDYPEIMSSSRGYLANMRRHQLKARGAWQLTPEWLVSGNLVVQSGMPRNCLGFLGPDEVDAGGPYGGGFYGSDYHWCRGEPWPPGKEFNPWTKRLDLGVQYQPAFADSKLTFRLDVFNVTDEQETLQTEANLHPRYTHTISNTYGMPLFFQTPRYVRFSVSYDY